MIWITENRIRRQVKRAQKKAVKMIVNCPKEYRNNRIVIKIRLSKHCYMDFEISNVQELYDIADGKKKS